MKLKIFLIVFSLFLFVSCGETSSVIIKQVSHDQMIYYKDVTSLTEGLDNSDEYVIFLKKGDSIPLQVTLENDFVAVEDKDVTLIAKKNIYFMIRNLEIDSSSKKYKITANSRIYVSFDALQWSPVYDLDGFKQIAKIEDESVSFGFSVGQDRAIRSNLVIESR